MTWQALWVWQMMFATSCDAMYIKRRGSADVEDGVTGDICEALVADNARHVM